MSIGRLPTAVYMREGQRESGKGGRAARGRSRGSARGGRRNGAGGQGGRTTLSAGRRALTRAAAHRRCAPWLLSTRGAGSAHAPYPSRMRVTTRSQAQAPATPHVARQRTARGERGPRHAGERRRRLRTLALGTAARRLGTIRPSRTTGTGSGGGRRSRRTPRHASRGAATDPCCCSYAPAPATRGRTGQGRRPAAHSSAAVLLVPAS